MGSIASNFILPPGTQIVTLVQITASDGATLYPRGAVGIIVKSPADNSQPYQVRLADEFETTLHHREMTLFRHFQREAIEGKLADFDLYDFVIYRCAIGPRAYGLDEDEDEADRRGIYLPPASLHWSLYGVPLDFENRDRYEWNWELQKFLLFALRGHPSALECLYTPVVETATALAEELISMRSIFVSTLIYQEFTRYVISQFRKIERASGSLEMFKWKRATRLIRLLLSGVTAMKEGYIPVQVEDERDELLSILRGEVPWNEVKDWRRSIQREFDTAFAQTKLPDRPDYEKANRFLLKARYEMAFEIGQTDDDIES